MFRKNETLIPKHFVLDNVKFSVYTSEEIKKIAVTRLTTPLTFDSLGHPLSGGVYDKLLGPLGNKSDSCGTCNQNFLNCPGHFGYIELPLPVINPIFHKTVGNILKLSCLKCFTLQMPAHLKNAFSIQIKLLKCGLISEAQELEEIVSVLVDKNEATENIQQQIEEYNEMAENKLGELKGHKFLNKNTESLKNSFNSDLLNTIKKSKICKYCKKSINKLQYIRKRVFMSVKKEDKDETKSVKAFESKKVSPFEARRYMREIWKREKDFLLYMVPVLETVECEYPTDVFFMDVVAVPPPHIRPVKFIDGRIVENVQSKIYKSILKQTIVMSTIVHVIKNNGDTDDLPLAAKSAYTVFPGQVPIQKLNLCWEQIQQSIDMLLDNDMTQRGLQSFKGLKQVIEKKEGIIRKHMMGKRVDYSARSVITPDPNLNIDEIGVPEDFAKRLTYPVPVTSRNVEELRKLIQNGPDVHPGALMVQFENGMSIRLVKKNSAHEQSILKRLLTPDDANEAFHGVKLVHRHLCNGDILLMNRQPSLHKPSIMGHKARVLRGEKTFRLHYANCKAYNADFDGDEMNAHVPQNELARSEGYNLANVSNQYLVPKDGSPLSGLIQDHVISAVRLSLRGRFFIEADYQQLVFQALYLKNDDIVLLPPTILKPERLWSGKQVLSTVIINLIPKGKSLLNLTASSKIPAKAWDKFPPRKWKAGGTPFENDTTMSEASVIIRSGELLSGILDKTHFGSTPFGLSHCVYELYGGTCAMRMLSSFSKLFTYFLQWEGFTLGVRDILTIPKADQKRTAVIEKLRLQGHNIITKALDLPDDSTDNDIVTKMDFDGTINPKLRAVIDRQYKSSLDSFTNDINKTCLQHGLLCEFPENNLQLMVTSGAKGSTVNAMQISCLLGQIELEGKRPPLMISGKSLPSFPKFEFAPRAGGFIDGRFMTGIQPQEFFFHCMAGREGLIDTAVKTSRSGYLQRCLVKHLEGLKVDYDMTVRDSDKTIIQFMYGEDGMDISKSQFLTQKHLSILYENRGSVYNDEEKQILEDSSEDNRVEDHRKKVKKWLNKHKDSSKRKSPFTMFSTYAKNNSKKNLSKEKIIKLWNELEDDIRQTFIEKCSPCPAPTTSVYLPNANFGSINERLESLIEKAGGGEFDDMIKIKAMKSLCDPGEPVGLLAAQSIGEPSTQMTLNTFHFAGRGEMNVTLGIPRLREILMMASKNIKTPMMEIPFLSVDKLQSRSEKLRKMLNRVLVSDVLEKIDVVAALEVRPVRQHKYTLRFQFLPHSRYKEDYYVTPKYIIKHMSKKFFGAMFSDIRKFLKSKSAVILTEDNKTKPKAKNNEDEDVEEKAENADDMSEESDEEIDEEDAKMNQKLQQTHDAQEPEEEEEKENSDEEEKENSDEEDDKISRIPENNEKSAHDRNVVNNYKFAQNYNFDEEEYKWCEIVFALPLSYKKLDLTAILRESAGKSVVWETPKIKRAITYEKDGRLTLRTDGINIMEMFKYDDLLDLNRLYCNDIHRMAEIYGIEAATKVVVKEVRDVFNVYGINVDSRHLQLIADYMNFSGQFVAMNKRGMEGSASPLQQMSFESSLTFLKNAIIQGKQDQLKNPSSCIMVGKPCSIGTGSFELMQKIFL